MATRLVQLAEGVAHESSDVRVWALRALDRLLSDQQSHVHAKLVLADDHPHPCNANFAFAFDY